jgi:putative membrane-bound dehydrogenase-like protein
LDSGARDRAEVFGQVCKLAPTAALANGEGLAQAARQATIAGMKRFIALLLAGVILSGALGHSQLSTGPASEKRFPPLKTPAGFKATLFACDPLIEYPSALALGPRPGTAFVAIDYLTGLGVEIVRRDEIRLIADTDDDGYADRATVFADGFNSIQGMTFHAGAVYVMHAPLLTVLRDTDGDDKADERRDLISGLGLPPEKNPPRLHCANGVVMGHDGWLYLALGDHGCDVRRPEGDRLVLEGGGILRCRSDGRDLHVFATGLRNIYDVALDAHLNVFVRDNENDGGDYKIRFCHSFFGADHGYPYHYYERPGEALPPLADLGLGSSAGGAAYLETQFPAAYRNNLFFCEWGRSVVRYAPERAGSSFAKTPEEVFAFAADNDPYGFKPTDIVVERDGSLLVSDWADGQRPKRGRGRIYRIQYVGETAANRRPAPPDKHATPSTPAALNALSHHARIDVQEAISRQGPAGAKAVIDALRRKQLEPIGRMHAVWLVAAAARSTEHQQAERDRAVEMLFDLARSDTDASVRVQAVRALADVVDPVLVEHRLDAGPSDPATARRLAALADGREPRVLLEVIVALGRLRWSELPDWLPKALTKPDAALAHSTMQALRRSGNWPGVLRLLDAPDDAPLRPIARRALAEQADAVVVDGLIECLTKDRDVRRRQDYADLLTRVHKKPGPWVYWGYRPAPRPANSVAWERSDAIADALDRVLADGDPTARLTVLQRMLRENVPANVATLGRWLRQEKHEATVTALVSALRQHPAKETGLLFDELVRDAARPDATRRQALAALVSGLGKDEASPLLSLTKALEDGPVLCEVLSHLAKRPGVETTAVLLAKLDSRAAAVRAAALDALVACAPAMAPIDGDRVAGLLAEKENSVRRAAADAAGRWGIRAALPRLLDGAGDRDADVRRASLEALRLLREPRVVPAALAGLTDSITHHTALQCLADLGGPEHAAAMVKEVRRQPAPASTLLALATLTRWRAQSEKKQTELDQLVSELQGTTGLLGAWQVVDAALQPDAAAWSAGTKLSGAHTLVGAGLEARVKLSPAKLAASSFMVPEAMTVQFLTGSSVPLRVWLNGKTVYRRGEPRSFQIDGERFTAPVAQGTNRVVVQLDDVKKGGEFHVRFRRVSSKAEHEQLTQAALSRPGNAERGRKVLFDVPKSQCLKCHRLGNDGEHIGPELTGVGNRFPRAYLIESILEPSRAMAPSFQTWTVLLKNGRTLTGLKIDERDGVATFADQKGDKHAVNLADIDEQRPSPQSTMPEGLERQLTMEEFVDLMAFLTEQKQRGTN